MSRNRSDNPVVLSRIYTRTGDDGTTALSRRQPGPQDRPRLAAYADIDEANCAIGVAITFGGLPGDIVALLPGSRTSSSTCGADLATPVTDTPPPYPPLRIDESYITRPRGRVRRLQRRPADAAQLRPARRDARARRCCTWRGP